MKITQSLLAEHVVFHNMFDYLEHAMPSFRTLGEIRTLSSFLESMLRVHSLMEDELLIEPLEACLCQLAQHENFHEEHEAIEESHRLVSVAVAVPVKSASASALVEGALSTPAVGVSSGGIRAIVPAAIPYQGGRRRPARSLYRLSLLSR